MSLSPEQRAQSAQLANHARWSRVVDRTRETAKARDRFLERFEREARTEFPDASDEQVARMAESRRKLYFTRLSFLSSKARAARAARKRSS